MSALTIASPPVPPPLAEDLRKIAGTIRRWAIAIDNIYWVRLFTHAQRPTVRVAIVSRTREYDSVLDDAVTQLDLTLAGDPAFAGTDIEFRLFFAATSEQVAAWARGWEPVADA